jgi:hypothetical protein
MIIHTQVCVRCVCVKGQLVSAVPRPEFQHKFKAVSCEHKHTAVTQEYTYCIYLNECEEDEGTDCEDGDSDTAW